MPKTSVPGSVVLAMSPSVSAADLVARYEVWEHDITVSVNVNPPLGGGSDYGAAESGGGAPKGSFAIAVSPKSPESGRTFGRSVVFALDRSGSMAGPPMAAATQALLFGLNQLTLEDEFTVVAFDHEQAWWKQGLAPATADNVADCARWVREEVRARGGTDIMGPVVQAFRVLNAAKALPCMFLVTDGCVDNEKDICRWVASAAEAHGRSQVSSRLPFEWVGGAGLAVHELLQAREY